MIVSLPNGKNLIVSTYEFLFLLDEDDVHLFYETCMADNLGSEIEDPFFSTERPTGFIKKEETLTEEEMLE